MSGASVGHLPVLPVPVRELLAPVLKPGAAFFDGTLGRGGHASDLLPLLGTGGVYIACDLDAGNLAYARARLEPIAAAHQVRLALFHGSFAELPRWLKEAGVPALQGLLADLGFASTQVDDATRGFSFMQDGPLDMRLNAAEGPTAADLLARLPEREMADIFFQWGEEKLSRKIAHWIAEDRAKTPFTTTAQLADLCRRAYGPAAYKSPIHPATRVFQALRIAVNGELEALDTLLAALPAALAVGGRAGIIAFHSLEDRPVKQAFVAARQDGWGRILTKKPVEADEQESAANPRARSAKFRVIEKVREPGMNPAGDLPVELWK